MKRAAANCGETKLVLRPMSEVLSCGPGRWPEVEVRGNRIEVTLEDGRTYDVPKDPVKIIGLIHHLSRKLWFDQEFAFAMLSRIVSVLERDGHRPHPIHQ